MMAGAPVANGNTKPKAEKKTSQMAQSDVAKKLLELEKWNRKVLKGLRKREKMESDPLERKRLGDEIHAHEKRSRKVYVQMKALGLLPKDKKKEEMKISDESRLKTVILSLLIVAISFGFGYLLGGGQ